MSRLITGAGGSIGSELARLLVKTNENIILVDNSEFALFKIYEELQSKGNQNVIPILTSLDNINEIRKILKKYSIRKIYNAAAYKHVNLVELNKKYGLRNNLQIIINLIHAMNTIDYDLELIQVSTDKAVMPVNMMGFSKRACELYLQQLSNAKCKIVRFGNVLNSSGSVVPIFRDQIQRGGPVTVTSFNAKRYFMTIPQACELIISVEGEAISSGIYVLDMGEPERILTLAQQMIMDAGFEYSFLPEKGKIHITEIGLRKGEKEEEELTSGSLRESNIQGVYFAMEDYSSLDKEIINTFTKEDPLDIVDALLMLYENASN